MNELFEVPHTESPRLKWIKKHRVTVHENIFKPTHSDDFRFAYTRRADSPDACSGYGNTDDEAILDLAKRRGWKLWNEE